MKTFYYMGVVADEQDLPKHAALGDLYYEAGTEKFWMWTEIGFISMLPGDDEPVQDPVPKIHPTNCKNCGAALHSYVCEYCGTEYTALTA